MFNLFKGQFTPKLKHFGVSHTVLEKSAQRFEYVSIFSLHHHAKGSCIYSGLRDKVDGIFVNVVRCHKHIPLIHEEMCTSLIVL